MIDVQNLYKSYGSQPVLKGLNLALQAAETVVVLGRSGVGKSVLLKQILGIEKPDSGSIFVDGKDLSTLSQKEFFLLLQEMGMLFQGGALFDSMNVFENVAFHLRQHGFRSKPCTEDEIKERVAEALSCVGLQGVEEKNPSELSGGMRKRAALARIIIYHPRILLYDEPTTGLDPITAMQINELILRVQKQLDATSIVVTHDLASAMTVADRLALHHDGVIRHIAEKNDFFAIDDPLVQDFLQQSGVAAL